THPLDRRWSTVRRRRPERDVRRETAIELRWRRRLPPAFLRGALRLSPSPRWLARLRARPEVEPAGRPQCVRSRELSPPVLRPSDLRIAPGWSSGRKEPKAEPESRHISQSVFPK